MKKYLAILLICAGCQTTVPPVQPAATNAPTIAPRLPPSPPGITISAPAVMSAPAFHQFTFVTPQQPVFTVPTFHLAASWAPYTNTADGFIIKTGMRNGDYSLFTLITNTAVTNIDVAWPSSQPAYATITAFVYQASTNCASHRCITNTMLESLPAAIVLTVTSNTLPFISIPDLSYNFWATNGVTYTVVAGSTPRPLVTYTNIIGNDSLKTIPNGGNSFFNFRYAAPQPTAQ